MPQTLASSSRTISLPNYAENGFKELIKPNLKKNYTLDQTLYVTFMNIRNGWTIQYDILLKAQYDELRAVYNDQFNQEEFLTFIDTDLGIDKSVFMNMPDERNIKWNKRVVEGLIITLEPEHAVSNI